MSARQKYVFISQIPGNTTSPHILMPVLILNLE